MSPLVRVGKQERTVGSYEEFVGELSRLQSGLTERELEILQLVADGLTNREIARRLVLAEETIKSHIRHVLRKLGVSSRAHAVAIAFRRGILT
jgi:DNA-binding NarL/FixJ family response regulator